MDANILINFSRWIPLELNDDFWKKLEISLSQGKWILLDVVVDEITSKGLLKTWCQKQKANGLVVAITDVDRELSVEINNNSPMVDQTTFKSTTDTFIIAYASNNNVGVFSAEMRKTPIEKLFKIPDVCAALGLNFTHRPINFLESINFRA